MEKIELASLLTLQKVDGIGNRTLWKIKANFGSFNRCFTADTQRLYTFFKNSSIVENILNERKNNPLDHLDDVLQQGIQLITVEDDLYPPLLANIYDPPYILYFRGNINICCNLSIGIVGSRAASNYGKTQAFRLAGELAAQNIVIVSGLARGIDTQAHRGALEQQGLTIAVLGSGIDIIYPRENKKLAEKIATSGLLLSEFPLGTSPLSGNFPRRNRIISGLSHGILIVEAKLRSGALITADFALEQGRDVFALPGPINSKNSAGTNNLIKQGAKLVTDINDIMEEYNLNVPPQIANNHKDNILGQELDNEERKVLECLSSGELQFDEIMRNTAMTTGLLSSILFQLELKGLIKAVPGNRYICI